MKSIKCPVCGKRGYDYGTMMTNPKTRVFAHNVNHSITFCYKPNIQPVAEKGSK